MDRIIEVKITGCHLTKSSNLAGVAGEANVTALRIEFDESWDGYAKTITWLNASGENTSEILLTADLLEDIVRSTSIYMTLIPKEALSLAGETMFAIDGYTDGKRQRSVYGKLIVRHGSDFKPSEDVDLESSTVVEALQSEIEALLGGVQDAQRGAEAAKDGSVQSAASAKEYMESAVSARDESVQGATSAKESAEVAELYAFKAEGAVGKTSYIGENGNWFAWDSQTGAFYDTGVRAQAGSTVYVGENPPPEATVWINPDVRKIDGGGEIFNDYEGNKALGPYTQASGYSTTAGVKGYYFVRFDVDNTNTTGTFYLSDTQTDAELTLDEIANLSRDFAINYAVGDIVSYISGAPQLDIGKITAIDTENKSVTVTATVEGTLIKGGYYTDIQDQIFYVADKPTDGIVNYGHYASAEGEGSIAIERASRAEGILTIGRGHYSHAEGNSTKAGGRASHAEGTSTQANGANSHAEGQSTQANGVGAHAEGRGTVSSGQQSHAEGRTTKAISNYSHAEGYNTQATDGIAAHAEGSATWAKGSASHAEGASTQAQGVNSHAEGYSTTAIALNSHAEGSGTQASGEASHAEGREATAEGIASHAEGTSTQATAEDSHAEGNGTEATGRQSHAEGYHTFATSNYSHAEGQGTTASGSASHAEGQGTTASGSASHAEGQGTTASGIYSHAEGYGTTASGKRAHAEGQDTVAEKDYSHAEGVSTQALGTAAHSEGSSTTASGSASHAEGQGTTASGIYSHAEGYGNYAGGDCAHVEGKGNNAYLSCAHVEGQFSLNDTERKYMHILGNGVSDTNRKNLHTIDTVGNAWFAGSVETTALILTSPNGTKYKLAVSDDGELTAIKVLVR